ncbi:MAG: histidine--tRNA ligase [Elusimicrobiales bacterium]|nr:histidine--tRNA ligase [Elusimicrobiales bacterium]
MIQPPRGFKDILPPQSDIFTSIEKIAREIFKIFNYYEIRLPTLEYYELFIKSTGETSDIVQKEMYKFEDSNGRLLALRPEGTPGIVRSYINNSMHISGKKTKFFYIANMFRAERPQAGRYREFEQIGAEYIGDSTPYADAEIIIMLDTILKELKLSDYKIEINSIGCSNCRVKYKKTLIEYLKSKQLCKDCKIRVEKNPLRILDCKIDKENLLDTPKIQLCEECITHHNSLKEILKENNIDFEENHLLVRGLDYYTKTVFEFKTNLLGSQDAIGAGGRYDKLVASMNGPDVAGTGWACGVERIAMLIEKKQIKIIKEIPKIFIVSQPNFENYAFKILNELRKNKIPVDYAGFGKTIKSQFRTSDSNAVDYVIIIGENEIKESYISLKILKESKQIKIKKDELINFFLKKLEGKNDENS